MPRTIDPAAVSVGSGTAPAGTVEDSSVVRYAKATDTLRAHVQDPTRSHMASAVGLADLGGFFSSEESEGALQELGSLSATIPLNRQNGWYEAGAQSISSAVTNVNRAITLAGTWTAVCTFGKYSVGGQSITLPDASTVWVFVHGTTGVLTQQVGIPDITTLEHVIVGRFTCAGNTVTSKEDGRFFVRNDNRKVTYSVRSDSTADANAEGSFFSLAAAFLWLATYSSGVSRKTKILVRGSNTITNTLNLPVDNCELEGEPGASIIASGGAPVTLFNLNGKTNFRMSKLSLVSNAAGSTAFLATAAVNGFFLDGVSLSSGTGSWSKGVQFTTSTQTNVRISDCSIEVEDVDACAISLESPSQVSISHSTFTFTGGGVGPSIGILLGDKLGGGSFGTVLSVSQCVFQSFVTTGIQVYGGDFSISENQISMNGATSQGVEILGGAANGAVVENSVYGTHQISYSASGVDNSTDRIVALSVCRNQSAGASGKGVFFNGYVRNSTISGNVIDGWSGGPEVTATGIQISSNSSNRPGNVQVSSNSVTRCADGISVIGLYDTRARANLTIANFANLVGGVSTVTIGGVVLTAVAGPRTPGANDFQIGGTNDATALYIQAAINDQANAFYTNVVRATVSTNVVSLIAVVPGDLGNTITVSTNAATAVTVANLSSGITRSIEGVTIDSNMVFNCARSKGGLGPDTFAGTANKGIGLDCTFGCKVSNNDVREIGIMIDGTGAPVIPSSIGAILESVGIYVRNSSRTQILGNAVYNCAKNDATATARGIVVYQGSTGVEPLFTFNVTGVTVSNNLVSWETRGNGGKLGITGQVGIDVYLDIGSDFSTALNLMNDLRITGNQVSKAASFGVRVTVGNLVQLSEFHITGNQLTDCGTASGTGGIGVTVADAAAAVVGRSTVLFGFIESNSVDVPLGDGISVTGSRTVGPNEVSNIRISRNKVRLSARRGIYVALGIPTLSLSDIKIEDNELLNSGTTAGTFSAIHVESTNSSIAGFRNVAVRRNSAIGTMNAGAPAIGVMCASLAPSGVYVDDNVIEAADGTQSVGSGILVAVTGSDFGITKSSFSRNRIFSTTTGLKVAVTGIPAALQFDGNLVEVSDNASRPLWFEINKTTAPAANQFLGRHFSIRGNILRGGRGSLFHSLRGVKISDLVVQGNQFLETDNTSAESTGESAAFALILDANAGLGLSTNPAVRNLLIEGNSFHDCQEEGLVLNLGPGIPGTYTNAQECTGITIQGNTFASTAISANGIGGALRILSCAALRDLIVDDNSFDECGAGAGANDGIIQIDFMSFNVSSLRNTSISRNSCDGPPITFIKLKELAPNNVSAPNANIQNLRVVGNQLTNCPVPLLWMDFTTGLQDYILEHISIEDNNVVMITGGQYGVNLDLDGDLKALSVSGNKFSGPHLTSIFVRGEAANTDREWEGLAYESNDLSGFSSAGVHQFIEAGAAEINVYNQKVSDNRFFSGGGGVCAVKILHDSFNQNAVWEGLTVSDNTAKITNAGSIFVEIDSNLLGSTKRCFSFTGNTLVTVGNAGSLLGGVWAAGNILLNLVVTGNCSDGNSTTWAAFAAQFNVPVESAIADNAT